MGHEADLYGVLVTYSRPRALVVMLARLAAQTQPLTHLVVVDNQPDVRNRDAVDRYAAAGLSAEYVEAPDNLGPAGGIAWGMTSLLRRARPDDWILTFDDDDPPPHADTLERLSSFAAATRELDARTAAVGLVGARFDDRRGRLRRVPDGELHGPVPVDYIAGNHLPMYHCRALAEVGTFRADLFFGFEELDFGLRLRRAGYRLYADGEVWRGLREYSGRLGLNAQPSRALAEPTWRRYYSLRNLLVILAAHDRPGAALRVGLVHGVAKPAANLPRNPWRSLRHLALNLRAMRDARSGRMGRALEPTS